MNILADASLPGLALAFPEPFHITLYHHQDEVEQLLPQQDVLLCRANLKVNQSLLKNHPLRYVATASSGTDHLDHQWLNSQNIQIIDAKGCNARAVADYVVASLAYLEQHQFILGKKAGIVGLGKVGSQVSQRLRAAGYQVVAYDPLKEMRESDAFQSGSLEDLYQVDLLCVHAELHHSQPYPSHNLINQQFLTQLKSGCVIINAARGGIIDEEALLDSQHITYCTDVYFNEPELDKRIIDKAVLCTPHIAGHSLEAKYLAVAMISERLHELAGITKPNKFATPEIKQRPMLNKNEGWQETILSIYNPIDETLQLKESLDLKEAFLRIRKNHHFRHDFCVYDDGDLSKIIKLITGI